MSSTGNTGKSASNEKIAIAGLRPSDLKAILRGDQLEGTPNPKHLAHRLSFWFHFRPRNLPEAASRFTHTFHLGFLIFLFFLIELITGMILMVYYVPTPDGAYESILRLSADVPFGELLRDIHRLGAEVIIILVILHLLRTYLTDSFKGERHATWLVGVFLLVFMLGLAFTGYLLPWDQLAYWAVTIGTSMAEAVPLIGEELNRLFRGSIEIGADGLLRFYVLHVLLLPILCILFMGIHYYRVVRIHGISLPVHLDTESGQTGSQGGNNKSIRFLPDILLFETFVTCLVLLFLMTFSYFLYDAPLEHHADPSHTPLDVQAPWFFLWLQGLLKLGNKTIMGVGVPIAFFLFLVFLPYLGRSPRRKLRDRPLAMFSTGILIIIFVTLSYVGTHHYGIQLPPAVRITQDIMPEEGEGLLHTVPFDELRIGIYELDKIRSSNIPRSLSKVLSTLEKRIREASTDGYLSEAKAVFIIEDWQADLKRIALRIIWTNTKSDAPVTFERYIHLHRHR